MSDLNEIDRPLVLPKESSPERNLWNAVLLTFFVDAEACVEKIALNKTAPSFIPRARLQRYGRTSTEEAGAQCVARLERLIVAIIDVALSPWGVEMCQMAGLDHDFFVDKLLGHIAQQEEKCKSI